MSRRPATVTQADVARIIRAAKQAGAVSVDVPIGGAIVTVRLSSTGEDTPREPAEAIVL